MIRCGGFGLVGSLESIDDHQLPLARRRRGRTHRAGVVVQVNPGPVGRMLHAYGPAILARAGPGDPRVPDDVQPHRIEIRLVGDSRLSALQLHGIERLEDHGLSAPVIDDIVDQLARGIPDDPRIACVEMSQQIVMEREFLDRAAPHDQCATMIALVMDTMVQAFRHQAPLHGELARRLAVLVAVGLKRAVHAPRQRAVVDDHPRHRTDDRQRVTILPRRADRSVPRPLRKPRTMTLLAWIESSDPRKQIPSPGAVARRSSGRHGGRQCSARAR